MEIKDIIAGELVERTDGKVALKAQVEGVIDYAEKTLSDAQEIYDTLKQALIVSMLDNNIKTVIVGKYKLAVREYSDKYSFDSNRFMNDENEDIVVAFSRLETEVKESFDMEKFKAEHPEMYLKYLNRQEEEKLVIDEKKLHDTLPSIWEKYATKEEAKAPTISIKKVGE